MNDTLALILFCIACGFTWIVQEWADERHHNPPVVGSTRAWCAGALLALTYHIQR